jgi:hypothetical protein
MEVTMPRPRQDPTPGRPRRALRTARATRQAAPICPMPCRCGAPARRGAPARCPLPLDPLGPLAGASVRALADLGLSPREIARYGAVSEMRVRAVLNAPR